MFKEYTISKHITEGATLWCEGCNRHFSKIHKIHKKNNRTIHWLCEKCLPKKIIEITK